MSNSAAGASEQRGRCIGVGVGPGDPELITLKAMRAIRCAPVVAYFVAANRTSNARRVVEGELDAPGSFRRELCLTYPVTTEMPAGGAYETLMADFYDASAKQIAEVLDAGDDVAVLCEGDPFFYGSFMYLHNRLHERYDVVVIPGVPAMLAGAAALGAPLVCLNEVVSVLSGVLPAAELEARLRSADAAVVLKLGRNLAKVRDAVERAGLLDRAHYVERVTMTSERLMPLADVDPSTAPYFSMVIIPSASAPRR